MSWKSPERSAEVGYVRSIYILCPRSSFNIVAEHGGFLNTEVQHGFSSEFCEIFKASLGDCFWIQKVFNWPLDYIKIGIRILDSHPTEGPIKSPLSACPSVRRFTQE